MKKIFMLFIMLFFTTFVSAPSIGNSDMTKGKVVYTPPPFIDYSIIQTNTSNYWGDHFYTDYDLLKAKADYQFTTNDFNGSGDFTTTGEGGFGGLMPYDSATFDLGSVGLRWRSLFLSGDITTLGDITATGSGTFGDLIVDTDTLFVDKTNNRVGIGTTTPSYILDIDAGEIGDDNYDGLRIVDTGWKATSHPMLEFYNSNALFNGSLARIYGEIGYLGANSKLHFAVADSSKSLQDRMVIDKDGNVGIGVVAPTHKLNVVGNVNITGNLIVGGNQTLGQKITFAFGEIIDNIVDGWIRITGNLNVTGNITTNQIYGEMWYYNHTTTELNFAVDGVFYNLTFSESKTNGFLFNDVGDYLEAQIDGRYLVNYMASGDGQNNHVYYTAIFVNGINQNSSESHKKMSAGSDIVTMTGSGFIDLNVGDKIKLATADVGGTGTGNYLSSNLNLVRIGN